MLTILELMYSPSTHRLRQREVLLTLGIVSYIRTVGKFRLDLSAKYTTLGRVNDGQRDKGAVNIDTVINGQAPHYRRLNYRGGRKSLQVIAEKIVE